MKFEHIFYSKTIDDVTNDMMNLAWSKEVPNNLERRGNEFQALLVDILVEHCGSYLYNTGHYRAGPAEMRSRALERYLF